MKMKMKPGKTHLICMWKPLNLNQVHAFVTTENFNEKYNQTKKPANEYAHNRCISLMGIRCGVQYIFVAGVLSSTQRILCHFGLARNEIEVEKQLWEIDTRTEYSRGRWRRSKIIIIFVIRGRETRIDQNLLLLRNETTVQLNEHTQPHRYSIYKIYIRSFERYFHSVIMRFLLLPPI